MESVCKDLFFGSGVVARMLKQHSSLLFVNDLENYASKNDDDIQDGERVFYCYENALSRILEKIELCEPVLSNFESDVEIYQKDAVKLGKELSGFDIVYLDPPYNQHPYGSNYFMLNVILKNKISRDVSKVSGITKDWNRSDFNRETKALESMEEIIKNLDSRFVVVSYNSEGFISFDEMTDMLERYGSLETVEIKYNTFRGSRNLRQRDIHVNEFLFVLERS